jgi:serine/threonine protein kinase
MGQGGMATVYLAVQESFGRQVALKIMSDQLGKDNVWAQRFMHEARIVAQLSHSNIVPVFDVGSHEGRFYISMELLKGGKLDEKISRGLTVPEIVKIVCGVAAGLDYAGSKGFVHRDIKPDNIMFRDDGTPVILDFGIAKQKDGDSKMTKTGTIVGTTGYMSPEQAMGLELDERSDLYSLGIMFYELLTGHVPFCGDSAVAVLLKHVQEMPAPLPAHLGVFQPILDKALAKKPDDRYKRGSEMIDHLQEALTQFRQGAPATPIKKTHAVQPKPISTSDATIVTAPVTEPVMAKKTNRTPLIAAVTIVVIAAVTYAGMQFHKKSQTNAAIAEINKSPTTAISAPVASPSTPKTETPAVTPDPAAVTTVTEPAVIETPAVAAPDREEAGNKRVVARILLGAHECMKQHKYDCAKSKAESALDLDPDNKIARQIIANAEKAQKDAFSGDWNAK